MSSTAVAARCATRAAARPSLPRRLVPTAASSSSSSTSASPPPASHRAAPRRLFASTAAPVATTNRSAAAAAAAAAAALAALTWLSRDEEAAAAATTTTTTTTGDASISDEELRAHIAIVAKRLGVDADAVLAVFAPRLSSPSPARRVKIEPMPPPEWDDAIERKVDHTLLKADATAADIERLCAEAVQYHFYAVCVNGGRAAEAARHLAALQQQQQQQQRRRPRVALAAVVGFPLGAMSAAAKKAEALELATVIGVQEVDVVINVGKLKDGDYRAVLEDISGVVAAASPAGVLVKVILETALLTRDEIIDASILSVLAKADFVKTSTGFAGGGATVANVRLMRGVVGPLAHVKASGGVRTLADAMAFVEAGADRLGTSAGVAIATAAAKGGGGSGGDGGGKSGY